MLRREVGTPTLRPIVAFLAGLLVVIASLMPAAYFGVTAETKRVWYFTPFIELKAAYTPSPVARSGFTATPRYNGTTALGDTSSSAFTISGSGDTHVFYGDVEIRGRLRIVVDSERAP